ncbi:hypothetical protein Ancab_004531 [Ancistrocladus abbreviatus]
MVNEEISEESIFKHMDPIIRGRVKNNPCASSMLDFESVQWSPAQNPMVKRSEGRESGSLTTTRNGGREEFQESRKRAESVGKTSFTDWATESLRRGEIQMVPESETCATSGEDNTKMESAPSGERGDGLDTSNSPCDKGPMRRVDGSLTLSEGGALTGKLNRLVLDNLCPVNVTQLRWAWGTIWIRTQKRGL